MLARLACALGRHRWEPFANPETADTGSPYLVCSRCGKDKKQYDPPTPGQAKGMGVAGL